MFNIILKTHIHLFIEFLEYKTTSIILIWLFSTKKNMTFYYVVHTAIRSNLLFLSDPNKPAQG